MILEALKNKTIGEQFYGVEIAIGETQTSYHIVLVEKSKDSISIKENFCTHNFETLKEKLDKNIPIILTLTGNIVISKKVENTPSYKSKLLFNSNPNDFYWFEHYWENNIFVSVSRKVDVDKHLQDFISSKFYYLKVGLGPFIGISIASLISQDVEELQTFDTLLKIQQGGLEDFSISDSDEEIVYEIEDQRISNKNLVGFASVIEYLFPNKNIESTIETNKVSSEFLYKKLIFKVGVVTVLSVFIALLVNFFLQSHYQDKLQKASIEFSQQQEAYNKVITLKKDKKNKEIILEKSGIHNSQFLSYYASTIVETIPNEIKLERLEVFPVKGKLKKNQPVEFINSQIDIKGLAKANHFLSDWIKKIKKNKWVDSIEIVEYVNQNKIDKFYLKIFVRTNV